MAVEQGDLSTGSKGPSESISGLRTGAQPQHIRNTQPTRVDVVVSKGHRPKVEQRLGPPSSSSGQSEDVNQGESLSVEGKEQGSPQEVESELSVVELEGFRSGSAAAKEDRVVFSPRGIRAYCKQSGHSRCRRGQSGVVSPDGQMGCESHGCTQRRLIISYGLER